MKATDRGVWLLVALPWLALAVLLTLPAQRRSLLGEGDVGRHDRDAVLAQLRPTATPVAARATPSPVLPSPPPPAPSPLPIVPSPESQTTAEPPPLLPATPAPPAFTELSGGQISEFLEKSYREALPRAVGPVTGTLAGDVLTIEGSLEIGALGDEMQFELPAMLRRLVRGNTTLVATSRIAGSADGIVQLELTSVKLGMVPVPLGILSDFIRNELEKRGKVVVEPLVRPLRLPPQYSSLETQGDKLRLRHAGP